MKPETEITTLALDYRAERVGRALIVQADCREWLARLPENSLHAIVTDPPYGVKEYEAEQLAKREGRGGIWRIPPSFDGAARAPLPRFTALTERERLVLAAFLTEWAEGATWALRPGAHLFVATNSFLMPVVVGALVAGGLEWRGQIIRLVRTLRGGDRPKNAEVEFAEVSSLPRGCHEPWVLLRKPLLPGMKVSDCLREYGTGALRRPSEESPFGDVIESGRTPQEERRLAPHPSLKPQAFLRQLVQASLPLGSGVIADPFMGSGSTVAAAEALGLACVGVERHAPYFEMAQTAIPALRGLSVGQERGQVSQPTLF